MSYFELFETGNWTPPPKGIIEQWCDEYCLSRGEFCGIVGLNETKRLYRFITGEQDLSYPMCRRFLIWSRQVEADHFDDPTDDFFVSLRVMLHKEGFTIQWLCLILGIEPSFYYKSIKNFPQDLEYKIRENSVICEALGL